MRRAVETSRPALTAASAVGINMDTEDEEEMNFCKCALPMSEDDSLTLWQDVDECPVEAKAAAPRVKPAAPMTWRLCNAALVRKYIVRRSTRER
mmetsp:Transcript_17966/g.48843  ORF Transcript_17966/g.48843 Transcript_17966/m.48843 type:complete len:94 (-) Transcript_17966:11-292(-)